MILSVNIHTSLNAKIVRDVKRTGLTRSDIVRHILNTHYLQAKQIHFQTGP